MARSKVTQSFIQNLVAENFVLINEEFSVYKCSYCVKIYKGQKIENLKLHMISKHGDLNFM